jgi:RNA polymerase sigma factor (sigma-70 family)
MTDDKTLVRKALDGNAEALTKLIRKYQGPVYALALRHVGQAHVAEEIAQDVFLTAHRKLGQLKSGDRFGAWLRTITIRQCQMWLRGAARKAAHDSLAQDAREEGLPGAGIEVEGCEGMFRIDRMIAELPKGIREAAVLCLEEGVAPSAAAEVLGLKPGTLRKRLHDARARLQRLIVAKAERELQLHTLPKDFAERCVCHCEMAIGDRRKQTGKEVVTMAKAQNCGCGCLGKSKPQTKPQGKGTKKAK